MASMLTVSDERRRAQLARRHALAAGHRVAEIGAALAAMTALHATEAATPHLSLLARVRDLSVDDVEAALYADRSVLKVMAMRRTLWVVNRELAPAVVGSAGRRVADAERTRLLKDAAEAATAFGDGWIEAAASAVESILADRELSTRELRESIPELGGTIVAGGGTEWQAEMPIMTRLMTLFAADGTVVRARNGGHWRVSRPRFTSMTGWLGQPLAATQPRPGYVEVIRSWLHTFGPGTEADMVWWLGSTKARVRSTLAELDAVQVGLESGELGWLLPDDVDEFDQPVDAEPWVALLPTLDPTTMGWREREFYLDPVHTPFLFDRNGNGGSTVWVDGRIVGCWVQDEHERVRPILMEDISRDARRLLALEVDRLDEFLRGEHITDVFASPHVKRQRLG
jgi:hypothetical protein